jgi:hypothetical protein
VDKFIYCPQCGSDQLEITDYEDENREEDTDGRRCLTCNWEGDLSELVCHEEQKEPDAIDLAKADADGKR